MDMNTCAGSPDAVIAAKRMERESIEILGSLVAGWLQSPTVGKVMLSVIKNVLSNWSDGSRARKKISDIALKLLAEKRTPQPPSGNGTDGQRLGMLFTLLARQLNELQMQNPMHLADSLEGPLCEVIASTDFGEVKEMVDRAEEPIVELVRRLMGFVWDTYPAKLGTVISLIHPLGNIIVRSFKEIVKPLNGVSPDLFTDLIFSIIRSIDGRHIGELVNAVLEMVRQLHTGSLLQGEAGVPQFQMDLTQKLREIVSGIDPVLLVKTRVISAEFAEERANALSDIHEENAALVLDVVSRFASLKNPSIRAGRRRLEVYGNLPDSRFAAAVADGLYEIDTQGISEIMNTSLRMINNVHGENPDIFRRLFSELFMNIDTDALKDTVQWITRDIMEGLRPIASEILPVLIRGVGALNQENQAV
ncbi:MAG: hypothetical protein MUD15_12940 [Desulfobacterota bacterium]|nr:hypothetical protein [Thermodesulfobacteriota bacterium]